MTIVSLLHFCMTELVTYTDRHLHPQAERAYTELLVEGTSMGSSTI